MREELRERYRAEDEQIETMREVRTQEARVPLDDKYRLTNVEVRDTAIADEAQRVGAVLTLNQPTLHVERESESDQAETNATDREHWTKNTLWQAGRRGTGQHTYRSIGDAVVGDGGGWGKLLWDKDLWRTRYGIKRDKSEDPDEDRKLGDKYNEMTEEAKRLAGPPFHWLPVDDLAIYPVWSGYDIEETLEVTRVPVASTMRKFRLQRDRKGGLVPEGMGEGTNDYRGRDRNDDPHSLLMLEHWDGEWASWLIADKNDNGEWTGETVHQYRHKYGQPPYFYAPGLQMNWWRNRKVGWGVGQTKRWLVEYRSFLWTLHAQYAARDLLTPLFRQVPDSAGPIVDAQGRPLFTEAGPMPGEILNGRPGEMIGPIQYPQTSQALREQIAIVTEAIESLETPRVQSLSGLEGAGFAISQVLSEMRIRFEPLAQGLEQMLEQMTYFLWRLVRNRVQEKVWVRRAGKTSGWLGMGPDELKNTVGIEWHVEMERPEANLIKTRVAHERLTAGTWGQNEAIEFLGDNPDEIRRSLTKDRIRQTPRYQQLEEALVYQAAGRGDLLALAGEAQQAAQQGQVPGVMGTQQVPDQGNLAIQPGGLSPEVPQAPANNPNLGGSPGAVVTTAGAGAAQTGQQ